MELTPTTPLQNLMPLRYWGLWNTVDWTCQMSSVQVEDLDCYIAEGVYNIVNTRHIWYIHKHKHVYIRMYCTYIWGIRTYTIICIMECVSGFWHATAHFATTPAEKLLRIPHENAETPAISKTWGIGLAIVTMIVWWMKLQLLGFCWSIGYPELVSVLTFRQLIPNSTFHHFHPAQVRTFTVKKQV